MLANSPKLNPVDNLWHYLRSHYLANHKKPLANRTHETYDDRMNAGTDAYRRLTPEVLKSVCRCTHLERRAN